MRWAPRERRREDSVNFKMVCTLVMTLLLVWPSISCHLDFRISRHLKCEPTSSQKWLSGSIITPSEQCSVHCHSSHICLFNVVGMKSSWCSEGWKMVLNRWYWQIQTVINLPFSEPQASSPDTHSAQSPKRVLWTTSQVIFIKPWVHCACSKFTSQLLFLSELMAESFIHLPSWSVCSVRELSTWVRMFVGKYYGNFF